MLKQPRKLTNEEAAFAAENHSKIYDFLYENGLDTEDFYDVAVFGYLTAVQLYFDGKNSLDFDEIAYRQMLSACVSAEEENSLLAEPASYLEDTIADAKSIAEEAIKAVDLDNTLAGFSANEQRIAKLIVSGYSVEDIADIFGIGTGTVTKLVLDMCRRLEGNNFSPVMLAA